MHLRDRFAFTEGNKVEQSAALSQWRELMLDEMPRELSTKIRKMSDDKMLMIMKMMVVRMRFHKDIQNHTYFF
jgi:hypothetical protein